MMNSLIFLTIKKISSYKDFDLAGTGPLKKKEDKRVLLIKTPKPDLGPSGEVKYDYFPLSGFPVDIFVVNQHVSSTFRTTSSLSSNHFVCAITSGRFAGVAAALKLLSTDFGGFALNDHFC